MDTKLTACLPSFHVHLSGDPKHVLKSTLKWVHVKSALCGSFPVVWSTFVGGILHLRRNDGGRAKLISSFSQFPQQRHRLPPGDNGADASVVNDDNIPNSNVTLDLLLSLVCNGPAMKDDISSCVQQMSLLPLDNSGVFAFAH